MKAKQHYIFCFLLIAISGNYPVMKLFNLLDTDTLLLGVFAAVLLYYKNRSKPSVPLQKSYYYFAGCFLLIFLIQLLIGLNSGVGSIIRPLFLLTIPAVLYSTGTVFNMSYEISKITVSLIKLSFIFWIPAAVLFALNVNILTLIPDALLFVGDSESKTHIILHSFKSNVIVQEGAFFLRNCGMFWEPGGFAGIIGMGWLHFASIRDKISSKEKRRFIIWLVLGMISTQSSTGLIAIPLLLLITYAPMNNSAYVITRGVLVLPFFIILSLLIFKAVPQIGDKVLNEFNYTENHEGHWQDTRYGTVIILTGVILQNPLTGLGISSDYINNAVQSLVDTDEVGAMGNGMFLYIAQLGIPMMIIFLITCFRAQLYNFSGSYTHAILALIILTLLLQGELWMNFAVIYTFLFKNVSGDEINEGEFKIFRKRRISLFV